jgi:hypothetical protein
MTKLQQIHLLHVIIESNGRICTAFNCTNSCPLELIPDGSGNNQCTHLSTHEFAQQAEELLNKKFTPIDILEAKLSRL